MNREVLKFMVEDDMMEFKHLFFSTIWNQTSRFTAGANQPTCLTTQRRSSSHISSLVSVAVTVKVTAEFVVRLYSQPEGALHSQYAVQKRKDFRRRLNVAVDDRMSFSSVVRRFHARGAATESARSPIRRSVLRWKRSPSTNSLCAAAPMTSQICKV